MCVGGGQQDWPLRPVVVTTDAWSAAGGLGAQIVVLLAGGGRRSGMNPEHDCLHCCMPGVPQVGQQRHLLHVMGKGARGARGARVCGENGRPLRMCAAVNKQQGSRTSLKTISVGHIPWL